MRIEVDLWITPDGYQGRVIPGVGVAQHVKGHVDVPEKADDFEERARGASDLLNAAAQLLLNEVGSAAAASATANPWRALLIDAIARNANIAEHLERLAADLAKRHG